MLINGEKRDYPSGITINELIEKLNLAENKIVVEVDGEIVPKDNYSKELDENSNVEIVSFVGGG